MAAAHEYIAPLPERDGYPIIASGTQTGVPPLVGPRIAQRPRCCRR